MMMFVMGLVAFGAFLVPLAAPRYWIVFLAGVICTGLFLFIYWNALTASPYDEPNVATVVLPALRDGAVYLTAASLLYAVKRLFVRSMPRKPSNID
jgi:hypothetical protein